MSLDTGPTSEENKKYRIPTDELPNVTDIDIGLYCSWLVGVVISSLV